MSYNLQDDLNEPKSKITEISIVKEIDLFVQRIEEGYENELEAYIKLTDIQKAVDIAKEKILDKALAERKKYPEKTVSILGKKISITQSGRYDYSSYDMYNSKKKEIEEIQEKMKLSYQAYLKGDMFVTESGEVIPPAAFIQSKESLKIG